MITAANVSNIVLDTVIFMGIFAVNVAIIVIKVAIQVPLLVSVIVVFRLCCCNHRISVVGIVAIIVAIFVAIVAAIVVAIIVAIVVALYVASLATDAGHMVKKYFM